MKINKTKLLFIATLLFLAIPLVFSGSAKAFQGDGATHDSSVTGWHVPSPGDTDYGTCEDGVSTNVADCSSVRFPALVDKTSCQNAGHKWDTYHGFCSVNLKGQTRDQQTCEANGGTWTAPPVCVQAWTWTNSASYSESHDLCLRCHSSVSQERSEKSYWKDSYVKTGHKNMIRKVGAGAPWEGPDGAVYTADGSGNHIDWTNATVNRTDLAPTTRALYYIYGDWIAAGVSAVYDNSAAGDGTSAKYTCASCHTTGYVATNFAAGMKPATDYPSITTGITGSWELSGIQCTRCHQVNYTGNTFARNHHASTADSSDGGTSGLLPWEGAGAMSICGSCHNTLDLTVAGNAVSGGKFKSHMIGPEFLNSPHAKFAYTIDKPAAADIANAANYKTHFKGYNDGSCAKAGATTDALEEWNTSTICTNNGGTWTKGTEQGNCATCHDVHNSLVVDGQDPFHRECGISCHSDKGDLSTIKHPNTPGTPLGIAAEEGNVSEACVICHMAAYAGQAQTPHLFRINTSSSYSTFSASGSNVNTADDGSGDTKAAWIDLDLACGQCHGGGASNDATHQTKYGAPYMSKSYLAVVANGMHQASEKAPTAAFKSGPSAVGLVATVVDGSTNADSVKVNWGDGSSVTGSVGGTFTHTYKVSGTYPVTLTAYSAESGLSSATTGSLTVAPAKYAISGTVTYKKADGTAMTPAKGAMVVVKKVATGTTVWYQRNVLTTYSTTGLNSGRSYSVNAVLKNFSCVATPGTVSLTTDTTVDILCTRAF